MSHHPLSSWSPLEEMSLNSPGHIWSCNRGLITSLFSLSSFIPSQPTVKPAVGLFDWLFLWMHPELSCHQLRQQHHHPSSCPSHLGDQSPHGSPYFPRPPIVNLPLSGQRKCHFLLKPCSMQNQVSVSPCQTSQYCNLLTSPTFPITPASLEHSKLPVALLSLSRTLVPNTCHLHSSPFSLHSGLCSNTQRLNQSGFYREPIEYGNVFVYECVHICIYVYVCMYICVYACMYVEVYLCICVCVGVCTHMYLCA